MGVKSKNVKKSKMFEKWRWKKSSREMKKEGKTVCNADPFQDLFSPVMQCECMWDSVSICFALFLPVLGFPFASQLICAWFPETPSGTHWGAFLDFTLGYICLTPRLPFWQHDTHIHEAMCWAASGGCVREDPMVLWELDIIQYNKRKAWDCELDVFIVA